MTKNFLKGLVLCEKIAEVAEGEGHHPDLHLTGQRAGLAAGCAVGCDHLTVSRACLCWLAVWKPRQQRNASSKGWLPLHNLSRRPTAMLPPSPIVPYPACRRCPRRA